jgi:hypothetical protein
MSNDMWPETTEIKLEDCTCDYHTAQARAKLERRLTKIISSKHPTDIKVSMIINHFKRGKL